MTVRNVLDHLDHEVWVRVRPPTGGDLVIWSADWIGDYGWPDELKDYLGCDADYICIELHENPEGGDETPMIVVRVSGGAA